MTFASCFTRGRAAALALVVGVASAPVAAMDDYGLGAFPSLAAWQAAGANGAFSAPEPMDYGLGVFATLAQYESAGRAGTTVAAR